MALTHRKDHRARIEKSGDLLPKAERGRAMELRVDGRPVLAYEGETIATALLAAGVFRFRLSSKDKAPRGLFCGMGVCYECLVTVNGTPSVRACVTNAKDGMVVETCKEPEFWTKLST